MSSAIALVGMACCYPDARDPHELWENVLAQRRAFRRLPAERLSLDDYLSADPATPDAIYAADAAVIEGYEFDRARFRVAGPIFRSVDLTHWLALDVADRALADAGLANGRAWCGETTGVLVGNTLTGEFSRAATLRLRWPYVRRVLDARLREEGWPDARRRAWLRETEQRYKSPFADVGEETLAGALSNTIAGRICNYFHFGGGGYTVDGACSASLLAVAHACAALEAGEIDLALAGGVDLSLDPFELVGFAKAGALARGEMRVYDRESTGFLPGEGCGFVVLARAEDARAHGLRTYSVIRGWGVSSDGGGGITRPEVRGQTLALDRAYRRAGYGIDTVALFEGHGTGTPVGDEVELTALLAARERAGASPSASRAAVGSIKANIGHTKAAAGVAGLIKATMAVHHARLPPTTGVRQPRPEVDGSDRTTLRVLEEAEPWPAALPLRAGVSAFGFGGINVHVTIEGPRETRPVDLSPRDRLLASSPQDAELFLFAAETPAALAVEIDRWAARAAGLSLAELADASAALARRAGPGPRPDPVRAALVASRPAELHAGLDALRDRLASGAGRHVDPHAGIFLGLAPVSPPRITYLFPGQASPVRLRPGPHGRRFPIVRDEYQRADLPDLTAADLAARDLTATDTAQIAIITAELAGLRLMQMLGLDAALSVGHSLGELAAYYWAGAMSGPLLLGLTRTRGRLMATVPGARGVMASIAAPASDVASLLRDGEPVTIACYNAARQIVIAGERTAVERVAARAHAAGWPATMLTAGHAFHSQLMAPAAEPFGEALAAADLQALRCNVVSTITGSLLGGDVDPRALLREQLTSPVRFADALACAAARTDLFIEVGPGSVLTHLARAASDVPAIALDIAGPSLAGVLHAAAAAYVLGAPLRIEALVEHRFTRPFDLDTPSRFLVNPCETIPAFVGIDADDEPGDEDATAVAAAEPAEAGAGAIAAPHAGHAGSLQVIRDLVARRTELPAAAIADDAGLLRDLHLNSIVVGELVVTAARQLGVAPPANVLQFADATIAKVAEALDDLRASAGSAPALDAVPLGVDEWCRAFQVDWIPDPLRPCTTDASAAGEWHVLGSPEHPLRQPLMRTALPGSGVIVCLSSAPVDEQADLLLDGARAALRLRGSDRRFVVIEPAPIAAAFVRTVHLEHPDLRTRVIEAPFDARTIEGTIARIRDEIAGPQSHREVRYGADGARTVPRLRLLTAAPIDGGIPLEPGDVVLVSGGAKGITADCAAVLARDSGARLALLGRSRLEEDDSLPARLRDLAADGVEAHYYCADATDPDAVRAAVRQIEETLGPVRGILHGAGHNAPALLIDLDEAAMRRTLAPKVAGFRNLLAAVDTSRLRLVVTLGSVIGRFGLRGQADYALANAGLTRLTEELATRHPACRCLALESSAWSGVGMAERLGRVEALRREGVVPISREAGVSWFRRLVARPLPAPAIVLTGRLGPHGPWPNEQAPLRLLRFVERPRVHYPGVELIVDADLTTGSDPYLLDHVFHGEPLLPAVMGLEAVVQTAAALRQDDVEAAATAVAPATAAAPPIGAPVAVLEDVHFERPIIVEPGARVTVRIAALVRESGRIDVVVRSSQTSFQLDHFRCGCRFETSPPVEPAAEPMPDPSRVALDADRDLYADLLFQRGRFRRVAGYRRLSAGVSWADIAAAASGAWFSTYLPPALLLGDAGARDAALHSIQACVPHAVLLPVAVDRVIAGRLPADQPLVAHARERWQEGPLYCYDLDLRTADGALCERWEGLQLRKVAEAAMSVWPDALALTSLEWRVRDLIRGTRVSAAFERDRTLNRRLRSERAMQRALDRPEPVHWRADGKPDVAAPLATSSAHADGLTLAVAGPAPVACDLEPIRTRSEQTWRDLLGVERWSLAQLIASQAGEDLDAAATRVWTAVESLTKAGVWPSGPLVLEASPSGAAGCVALSAPGLTIATSIIRFRDDPAPVAVAVLARSDACAATSTGIESLSKRRTS